MRRRDTKELKYLSARHWPLDAPISLHNHSSITRHTILQQYPRIGMGPKSTAIRRHWLAEVGRMWKAGAWNLLHNISGV